MQAPTASIVPHRGPRIVCAALGVCVTAVGLTSFMGWAFDLHHLTDWFHTGISMQPNTALCALLSGLAVVLLAAEHRRAARAVGCAVGLIGWATAFEWLSGVNLGIDTLFIFGREWGRGAVLSPGRMGLPSTWSWALIGLAFLLAGGGPRARRLVPALGLAVAIVALVSLVGYLFRANVMFTLPRLSAIAMQTAMCIFAVGMALVASEPDRQPLALLVSDSAAGALARRMLPLTLGLPLLLGALVLVGLRGGFFEVAFGVALRTVVEIALLAGLAWWGLVLVASRERAVVESNAKLAASVRRLAEEKERYAVTLGSIGDAVIATDPDTRITFMNPVAEQLTGWPLPEALGKPLAEVFNIVNEATREPVESPITKCLRVGTIVGMANHTMLIARDGGQWTIDDRAAPIRRDGAVVGVVMVFRDVTARRSSERALADSEALKSAVLATALDCIIIMDHHGKVVDFNPAAERTFGYRRDEAIGQEMGELIIPPALREAHKRGLARYLASGEERALNRRLEVPAFRRDGTEFPAELAITRIPRDGPPLFAGYIRDITDRVTATETLRASERRATDVLEGMSDGYHVIDAEWRFAEFNAAARRMYAAQGQDADALRGRHILEEAFPDVRDTAIGRAIARTMIERVPTQVEEYYAPWDRWSRVRNFPIVNGGMATFFQDITESKRAEEALRQSEESVRKMADAMRQLAWIATADGAIHWYNKRWYEYTGATPAEMEGWGWQSVHDPAVLPTVLEKWRTSIATGEPFEMIFPLRGRDGTYRSFLTRIEPQKDAEGVVTQWFGTNTDIDDVKRIEEALRTSETLEREARAEADALNRAKDLFLATLSHEIRTPLNAIVGWTSILRKEGCNEEDLREGLNVIDRNARMQSRLIEDVMDVSRIVTGKMRLEMQPCDLRPAVRAGVDAVRPAAAAKDITLDVKLGGEAATAVCDAARIQQIVWNLVSNAVKFTPKRGTVTVRLTRRASSLRLTVSDTGPGIDPDLLPHVFDRFRQADSSTRRKFGGLGLGLSIVKHLTELHGGTVEARNEGQGTGATFTVMLPIQAGRFEEDAEPGRPAPHAGGAGGTEKPPMRLDGLRVLVVDDEPDSRNALTKVLQSAGAIVVAAASAAEAKKLLETVQPNVLVSDLGMPDEDGYDLIRDIRAKGHTVASLPAVALTAFAGAGYARAALIAGFQMHVPKPVDPHDLVVVVGSLTGRTGG